MQEIELDPLDVALLNQLQIDCSLSNQALAKRMHVSPPTCLRRVKRLLDAGLIERQIALVDTDLLALRIGHGLTAIVEITLDRQHQDAVEEFERRVAPDAAVQQCYRVSPGPDFILVIHANDMPGYLALSQRLFTSDTNVRNVKTFFSIKRAKFEPRVALMRPERA